MWCWAISVSVSLHELVPWRKMGDETYKTDTSSLSSHHGKTLLALAAMESALEIFLS